MKRTIWVGRCADRKRPYCYSETKPRANDKGQYVMSDSGWSYMTEDFFGTNIPLWGLAKVTIDSETRAYWIEKERRKGWYPVIMQDKVSLREVDVTEPKQRKEGILWWNGDSFVDDSPSGSRLYGEHQFSWIADEPIPDPFEKVEQ